MLEVIAENEAPPVVRVFANQLRLSLQRPGSSDLVAGLEAIFALKSSRNAQALTIRVKENRIELSHGVAPDSQIVITMDFDNPSAGQKIEGLWRHPLIAYKVGKIMNLPLPNWADSAKRFRTMTGHLSGQPATVTIICTDENRRLSFGEGDPEVQIVGTASALEAMLAGSSLLAADVMTGKLQFRGSMRDLAELSRAGQMIMLGELNG